MVEFGTADEYSIMRGDCLDRWVRFEGRNDPNVAHFQDAYKDIMCPPDLSWRRMVLDEGPAIMDKLIAGVAGLVALALHLHELLLARICVTSPQPHADPLCS